MQLQMQPHGLPNALRAPLTFKPSQALSKLRKGFSGALSVPRGLPAGVAGLWTEKAAEAEVACHPAAWAWSPVARWQACWDRGPA